MLIRPAHMCSYVIHLFYIPNLPNLSFFVDTFCFSLFLSSTHQQSRHELSVSLQLFDSDLTISLIITEIFPQISEAPDIRFAYFALYL